MARTSIEENGMTAARLIARRTGITANGTIGMLIMLWHDSQSLERTHATREQLITWLNVSDSSNEDEENTLISALEDTGILLHEENDLWLIVGNEKHIENLKQHKLSGRAGGKASGVSRSKRPLQTIEATASISPKRKHVSLEPYSILPSSIQYNSIQEEKRRASRLFDFASIYQEYPRKLGKAKGLKIAEREIKTEADFDRLMIAVKRYAGHVRRENLEADYVKHFSTFMSSWEDWLDDDVGKFKPSQPPRPAPRIEASKPEDYGPPDEESLKIIRGLIGQTFKSMPT